MLSGSYSEVVEQDQLDDATRAALQEGSLTVYQAITSTPVGSRDQGGQSMHVTDEANAIASIGGHLMESRTTLPRFAPIDIIPPEILSCIFALAALPSSCINVTDNNHKLHPLVAISSVCTKWRHLAIRTRLLWAHIDINEKSINSDWDTYWLNRTQLWLGRADGVPIHLHFQSEQRGVVVGDLQMGNILRPHMSRAVSLTFSRLSEAYARLVLNNYATCYPPEGCGLCWS
ncbi:hypothetical protein FRC08_017306 [Ceratobasidium sp. 394]|nr:hypothetical protein FRC08_017306 [Ceratobasidium sp. 394]KAG9084497.1 hypothetical protein FS749_005192 [Ceratobasidium sp. UAMH 11750]